MSDLKVNWNTLHEHTQHDIRKGTGIGYGRQADKKLEQAVQRHLDGANPAEKRDFYNKFYGRRER